LEALRKELEERTADVSFKDVFTIYRKPFLIILLGILMFNTSGTYALQLYSNKIFLEEVSLKTATILSNILFACLFIGNIIALNVYDHYGRK
jgi:uncharacterized membrane protein YesL